MTWEKIVNHHVCEGQSIFGFAPEGSGSMGAGSIHVCDVCGKRRELVRRVGPFQIGEWRELPPLDTPEA